MRLRRKLVIAAVGTIAAIGVATCACACWTANGGGSGTASVGSDSGVTISPVTFGDALVPGGSTVVSFTINNSSSTAPVKVDKVVADTSGGNTNGISGLPVG